MDQSLHLPLPPSVGIIYKGPPFQKIIITKKKACSYSEMATLSGGVACVLLVLCMVVPSFAAVYTVGDTSGWTTGIDYSTWTQGKTFKVGDTLGEVLKSPSHISILSIYIHLSSFLYINEIVVRK